MKAFLAVWVAIVLNLPALSAPLGSAFTYQGRLSVSGSPANGIYDLQIALFDSATGGTAVVPADLLEDTPVTNGLFTAQLNFGPNAFSGDARWLEIAVRPGSDVGPFTTLTPRQPLTAAPNALFAANAKNISWSNVTAVAVGPGMTVGPDNVFAANFAGSGTSNTVARSDHNHLGQTWNGAGTVGLGVETSSGASGATALIGRITDTTPGIFSVGVRGANLSTNSAGIGVLGTHEGAGFGVWGNSISGMGVVGSVGTQGANHGVYGETSSTRGNGVGGYARASSGTNYGVYGESASTQGRGVYGYGTAVSGPNVGVKGVTDSTTGMGVQGYATANSGANFGVYGVTDSTNGVGVFGSGGLYGVEGRTAYPNGAGVLGLGFGSAAAIRAAGNGIIQSTAATFVFVAGGQFTLGTESSEPGWGMMVGGGTRFQMRSGGGERIIYYPIGLPAVLYGQPANTSGLTIYFKTSANAKITATTVHKYTSGSDGILVYSDSFDRTSLTDTSYGVFLSTPLAGDEGIINIRLTLSFPSTSEWVQINGLRIGLTYN